MEAIGMLYHAAYSPMVLVFSQVVLMIVFLAGAWSKLRARETFEGVVYNYRLLPEFAVRPVSQLLPIGELAVALGLAYGPARPYAAIGAVLLLALFSIAIAVNLGRGRREIDCGCFSAVLKQHLSGWLIVRNVALMGLAVWIVWRAFQTFAGGMIWLDWLVGFAAAITVVFVYMTASLLATQSESARNSNSAR